jgi:hypothetical protein
VRFVGLALRAERVPKMTAIDLRRARHDATSVTCVASGENLLRWEHMISAGTRNLHEGRERQRPSSNAIFVAS